MWGLDITAYYIVDCNKALYVWNIENGFFVAAGIFYIGQRLRVAQGSLPTSARNGDDNRFKKVSTVLALLLKAGASQIWC